MPRRATWLTALLMAAALVATGAACGADPDRPDSATDPGDEILAEARAAAAVAYRGTYKPPDATPRPAAKGKKIVVISAGQASPSSAIPTAGAVEAGRALGWQVQVSDMQFNPANAPKLVKDAVASGVDGIVANFDCVLAPAEFASARARGIEIVPLYGHDCDDPSLGPKAGQPQFTTFVNYGHARLDVGKYTAGYGALTAHVTIATTNATAKVIFFTDPSLTALRYIDQGFLEQIGRCTGCSVVEKVEFSSQELGPGLFQKVIAALQRHPEATVVRTPFSAATLLSIAPALVKSGRHQQMTVVGGEGFPQDLDLIRTGKGLTTTFLVDSNWTGWSAVDALNSRFVHEETRPAGFGVMVIDREHNLTPSGPAQHNIDFKAIYRRAWGVG